MNLILLTGNKFKENEIREAVKGFGFNFFTHDKVDKIEIVYDVIPIFDNLNINDGYILSEETHLENEKGEKVDSYSHMDILTHVSVLKVTSCFTSVDFETKEYTSKVKGYINLLKSEDNNPNIYNWDDVFVCLKNMKTYHEMRSIHEKFSARQIVISNFLNDYASFKNKVDLQFNPFNQTNVVEFSHKIYDFISENEFLSLSKKSNILNPLMQKVLNNGIFTRSSLNKKQRNYWYPSLNAGLPLVPKKDQIHEVTFMFHDLMHHLIPDLIMTGNFNNNHKEAYVIHRMLSESFTIVLADMVFIDQLVKEGISYDWDKRKIYPVYRDMNIQTLTIRILKKILWANVNFALLGDYSLLEELTSKNALNDYINKYEKFFIEDYRWTINNFENMSKNKANIEEWYHNHADSIEHKNTLGIYGYVTQDEPTYKAKVKMIFNDVFKKLEHAIKHPETFDYEQSNSKAFKNYMIGQSIIFFNYSFHQDSETFLKLITEELNSKEILSIEDTLKIKNFFNLYLEKLKNQNVISENNMITYKEIVPFFEAFYVFYDKNLQYNNVKELIDDLFINKKREQE
jgi:hypothetical protein